MNSNMIEEIYVKDAYNQIAEKRVLILGTDWGLFETNKMASGFFEWRLARPVFTELNYFENVVLIDKALRDDAPDIIIDEENKMNDVFKRIPGLQEQYRKESNLYFRK